MRKILALWATPRSTSTAFEWMMRQRGDFSCWHEPFGEAWYQGEQPLWPRATADSPRTPGLTFASVWRALRDDAAERAVFIKDFPHYVSHMWEDDFLDCFTHTFLIRDPAKVITSMYEHWPDFELVETGIIEQHQLFQRLTEQRGLPPPVIDADDLLASPAAIVERYCQAVGIEFLPAALSWAPGDRKEVSWYDSGSWHGNLRTSDGLKPQPRSYIHINEAPARVQDIYAQVLPHYRALHAHRIVVA